MTGSEYKAQEIVANVVVESRFKIRHCHLFLFEVAAKFFVLALKPRVSPEVIDGTMLGGRHEPGARIVRNTGLRPLLERGDQSILREIFGNTDVPHDPRETGDEPWRLNPPDRVDGSISLGSISLGAINLGSLNLGAMWIGSRHSYRSHHFYSDSAS